MSLSPAGLPSRQPPSHPATQLSLHDPFTKRLALTRCALTDMRRKRRRGEKKKC